MTKKRVVILKVICLIVVIGDNMICFRDDVVIIPYEY